MKFLIQWFLVLSTVLNPILANAALTDYDRQEISHKNWLAPFNSGFESGIAKWTASGGTLAAVTSGSNLLTGKGSATWDSSSASQTLTSQTITIEKGYYGQNCEGALRIQTPSGTATHTIQAYDGTNILVSSTVVSSTLPVLNTINFPCPSSGTVALRLVSVNANEPLVAIDDAYLGLARNVGSTQLISEWTSFTPTGGWTGAVTYTGKWRRVGDQAEFNVKVATSGAPTGTSLTINLPSGFTIDTSKLASATANTHTILGTASVLDSGTRVYVAGVLYNSTTAVGIQALGQTVTNIDYAGGVTPTVPMTFASGDTVDAFFTVPIVGWTAQTVASIDAISKRGSISFASGSSTVTSGSLTTFNVAGFGTNTLEGQALAPTTANDFGIRMAGAPAATYEVVATGKFYASSAATTGTRTICEYRFYDGTNYSPSVYAIAPGGLSVESNDSVATITGSFVLASAGTLNVVLRGQRVSGNGTCYAEAGAYISIKNVSQPSPAMVLPLSVSSALSNGGKLVTAVVQAVNGSTCTVSEEDGTGGAYDWLGSTTPIATGRCTVAINTGVFSAKPKCAITGYATTYTGATQSLTGHFSALSATSMTLELRYDVGGSNAISGDDSPMMVMCFGAR